MTDRLARTTELLALGLILYLPLEPAILSVLPSQLFWFLRLAPDALIALVAAALVIREVPRPSRQSWLLVALGALGVSLIIANAARGFSPVDTINALRVVLRYPILGIVVWRAAPYRLQLPRRLLPTVLAAGLIEVAAGLVDTAGRLAGPLGTNGVWLVQGTTGRYDQLGFSMAALLIVVLVLALRRFDWRLVLAGVLAVAVLALTTSRQAMLVVIVAAVALTLGRLLWSRRLVLVAVSSGLVVLILLVPSTVLVSGAPSSGSAGGPGSSTSGSVGPDNPDGSGPSVNVIVAQKGATKFSLDPNRNFRLYLNLVLMPWATVQEPLLGFGPRQQITVHADPRLTDFVTTSGMDWAYATQLTGDSNYASLVIQFGIVLPAVLFLSIGFLTLSALRAARRTPAPGLQLFAFAVGAAFIAGAAFGPAFEARIASIILWVTLFTAYAYRSEVA